MNTRSFADQLLNEDQKLSLSLPFYVWDVIENDIRDFSLDKGKAIPRAGFLNEIIQNCHLMPELLPVPVNVSAEINSLCSEYEKLLPAETAPPHQELLQGLRSSCENRFRQQAEPAMNADGFAKKFRLNNHVFTSICDISEGDSRFRIYQRPAKYLKVLFTEYSRLPYAERERIYFYSSVVQRLHSAIPGQKNLIITSGSRKYHVIPYRLLADTALSHLYLACCSSPVSDEKEMPYRNTSFRISRITAIEMSGIQKALTSEQKKQLEENIKSNQLPFLVSEKHLVRLRLTPEGERKYKSMSYLRPIPLSKNDNVYEFAVSNPQMKAYFFKFGRDVEILDPPELRQNFIRNYRDALMAYNESIP